VVEEIEREKALEAGCKVTGMICNVLFGEQIRTLKRSSAWSLSFSHPPLVIWFLSRIIADEV
jgi:hypothetical protein